MIRGDKIIVLCPERSDSAKTGAGSLLPAGVRASSPGGFGRQPDKKEEDDEDRFYGDAGFCGALSEGAYR